MNSHDPEAIAKLFRPDALFSFPGSHSLAGDYRGRTEIKAFFGRLFERFPGLEFDVRDIAASGPPWRMKLWVRYHDTAADGRWSGWGTQYAIAR